MKLDSVLKEKVLLIAIALLILFSGIFYFSFMRPLAAEKAEKEATLQKIELETSSYEKVLEKLTPQALSETERQELFEGIPGRPNIEQVITDLGSAESETGISISSISFQTESDEEGQQAEGTINSDGTVDQDPWSTIFPESIYKQLEEKVRTVKEFTVSYEDIQISLNGNEEGIDQFVDKLEKLPRIFHIQDVTYVINAEKGNMDATVSARVFYYEAFQEVIE